MSITTRTSRADKLAALRQKIQAMNSPKGSTQKQDDDRIWKPELDKTGSGSAIIRFLSAKSGEEFPFVQLFTHGFQGPSGKWYIDNCPTSIGQECPACKANSELWNSGDESLKKVASARKRKLNYISNILVVNDPKHPENNGKVFLFKYGKKIWDKISDQYNPPEEFADMNPVDVFDMEEGANFKLRVIRQDGFPNYDKSAFDSPTSIGDSDRQAEIESQLYSLNELIDPKHFKAFDVLKKRFDLVTGETGSVESAHVGDDDKPPFDTDDMPVAKPKTTRAAAPKSAKTAAAPKVAAVAATDDEDVDEAFLRQMAQPDED